MRTLLGLLVLTRVAVATTSLAMGPCSLRAVGPQESRATSRPEIDEATLVSTTHRGQRLLADDAVATARRLGEITAARAARLQTAVQKAHAEWAEASNSTIRRVATVVAQSPAPDRIQDPAIRARIEQMGLPWRIKLTRSMVTMVLIPPGSGYVGAGGWERDRQADEGPIRRIRVSTPFYMAEQEVTQSEWTRMGGVVPPGNTPGDDLPVCDLTWADASACCERNGVRLPYEYEWEYTCRSGEKDGQYGAPARIAQCMANRDGRRYPFPGGRLPCNSFGVFDMLGNVSEWCRDEFSVNWLDAMKDDAVDPANPGAGPGRVLKGGDLYSGTTMLAAWKRTCGQQDAQLMLAGVRILMPL